MKKSKIALILVIFIGCACALLLILQRLEGKEPGPSTTNAATPQRQVPAKQHEADYGVPVRLRIPKINVDAAIEHMGLTPTGNMQEPTNLKNAGWYKLGSRPGNTGSAVVAGHYGLSNDDAAVFNKLHTLSKGDLVHVEDEKGAIATFIVRELKTYNKNAAAPEVFSSNDEKAHLNLITCEGTWQKDQQTYSDRLVLFTDKQEVR